MPRRICINHKAQYRVCARVGGRREWGWGEGGDLGCSYGYSCRTEKLSQHDLRFSSATVLALSLSLDSATVLALSLSLSLRPLTDLASDGSRVRAKGSVILSVQVSERERKIGLARGAHNGRQRRTLGPRCQLGNQRLAVPPLLGIRPRPLGALCPIVPAPQGRIMERINSTSAHSPPLQFHAWPRAGERQARGHHPNRRGESEDG